MNNVIFNQKHCYSSSVRSPRVT